MKQLLKQKISSIFNPKYLLKIRKRRQHELNGDEKSKKLKKLESTFEDLVSNYEALIQEGPSFVCCCCGQLCFNNSVIKFQIEKYERFGNDYLGKVKNESMTVITFVILVLDILNKGKSLQCVYRMV